MSNLVALHGFLGKPDDWNFLHPSFNVHALDLSDPQFESKGLVESATIINAFAKKIPSPRILLGYSLGGRLALHALISDPHLWEEAIIISSHPGLETEKEKQERLQNDEQWAERFLKDSWNNLMADWNKQSVFNNQPAKSQRKESDYSRKNLAEMLRNWSLGRQKNLKKEIEELTIPLLWIAGEKDTKFSTLAKTLRLRNKKSKVWLAPQAGHRVPWEVQEEFIQFIKEGVHV